MGGGGDGDVMGFVSIVHAGPGFLSRRRFMRVYVSFCAIRLRICNVSPERTYSTVRLSNLRGLPFLKPPRPPPSIHASIF